jgi:putative glycosyltransferase
MKISVVTPLFRTAIHVENLYRRCKAAVLATAAGEHEIIFVNDCSPDASLAEAKKVAARDPHVVVVDLARNYGQHKAIMTGLSFATGDYVFVIDSDLDEEPEWIPLFFREMAEKRCDVVYGVSRQLDRSLAYRIGHRIFYRLAAALSDAPLPQRVCTARLMTRRYVDALMLFPESEVYLAGIWHLAGFAQVPIEVVKHHSNRTTYTLPRLAGLAANAITSYSTRPLLVTSLAGIIISAVALCYASWLLARKLFYGTSPEGWASVMAVLLLYCGLSFLFNGVMAIYVAKIFIEVKRRPRTIVREVLGGKDATASSKTSEADLRAQ